jgi:hypothetical protein
MPAVAVMHAAAPRWAFSVFPPNVKEKTHLALVETGVVVHFVLAERGWACAHCRILVHDLRAAGTAA